MAMTEAQKRAQERYRRAKTISIFLRLNKDTDADILQRIQDEPSKMGYVKRLIREDIARANEAPADPADAPANE